MSQLNAVDRISEDDSWIDLLHNLKTSVIEALPAAEQLNLILGIVAKGNTRFSKDDKKLLRKQLFSGYRLPTPFNQRVIHINKRNYIFANTFLQTTILL